MGNNHGFGISVKLNSTDFQKDGFMNKEAFKVTFILIKEELNILDLSSGNYNGLCFVTNKVTIKHKSTPKNTETV